MPTAEADIDIESTPDYWLIVLLRAIRESDLELAGEAQQHLRKLGIEIRFARLLGKTCREEGRQE